MGKADIRVIINPNAKKFRTGRSSIESYRNIKSNLVKIVTPSSPEELRKETEKMAKERCDYICIAGGDGTLHLTLSSIINSYKQENIPPILILKEGTMDNVARTIKLKGRGPQLLRRLVERIENNLEVEIYRRYTMQIDNKFCFLFGTGFVTNFLNLAYNGKEKGFVRNLQVASIAMREALLNIDNGRIFSKAECEIYSDGKPLNIKSYYGLLAGTVEHIGMGFSPLSDAVVDGKFQVIISSLKPRTIALNINKIRTGRAINNEGYFNFHSSVIKIKQKGRFEYTMDGDIYSAENELVVKIGPSVNLVKV